MAILKTCSLCHHDLSSEAYECPGCGHPLRGYRGLSQAERIAVWILLVLALVFLAVPRR
jgi:uncharacterized paraquat-inducible protein A